MTREKKVKAIKSLEEYNLDLKALRTTMSRAHFVERLKANGFKPLETKAGRYMQRETMSREHVAVCFGEIINHPHPVTVIDTKNKDTIRFNDWGQAFGYMRKHNYIGAA